MDGAVFAWLLSSALENSCLSQHSIQMNESHLSVVLRVAAVGTTWLWAVVKLPSHTWGIPKFETRLYVCQTRGKVSNKHKAFHPTVH